MDIIIGAIILLAIAAILLVYAPIAALIIAVALVAIRVSVEVWIARDRMG